MNATPTARIKTGAAMLALLFSLTVAQAGAGARNRNQQSGEKQSKDKVVYVCACLKTKSCSCMTEAKTEGPCSCGTEGGPPMKAVPKDSSWAKANRKALAH